MYKSHASVLQLHETVTPLSPLKAKAALSNEDIMRYSRQLLLPELGVQGRDDYGRHADVLSIPYLTRLIVDRSAEFVQHLRADCGLRRTGLPPGAVSCCSRHR